ncbi:response regulator transcription factor [Streptomyces sp. ME19-01-6]|uniref:response regulator transcription factor n=1 Tax=Streptomyces sp. ME19-01-6 TaxID=3028686 RepID=UPI0029AB6B7D|nr:response regulator transcription factor [Streptomyces sp. ME19-01-6]MDX3227171.1 response regulator transcription factor [Streptomyces sp. ME19-01-6]
MHETARTARILVVDDDPAVRDALSRTLRFEGYEVDTAQDGLEALARLEHPARLEQGPVDLVLLDVMMPGLDGLAVARRIRAGGDTVPIMMITARDSVGDRIVGLDNGADDYLTKPFAGEELLARVRALVRRTAPLQPAPRQPAPRPTPTRPEPAARLSFEDVTLDPRTRQVTRAGRRLDLTKTEYALLKLFLSRPRQVLTRAAILRDVWGFAFEPTSNTLDVYVMYLRRKTEARGEPRLLHTVRGVGYVLRALAGDWTRLNSP